MAITANQRAAIGRDFISNIEARIATRKEAQAKASLRLKQLRGEDGVTPAPEYEAIVKALVPQLKALKLQKNNIDISNRGRLYLKVTHSDLFPLDESRGHYDKMLEISISADCDSPIGSVGRVVHECQEAMQAPTQLKQDLCHEIEFLTGLLTPNKVHAFQTYVCRLWCPVDAAEVMTKLTLKDFIESFIVATRPVVCQR